MALITLVGVFLSANKKKRMQVFAELYEFNEQLILNLKFARNPISKVAEPFTYIAEIMNGKCVNLSRNIPSISVRATHFHRLTI